MVARRGFIILTWLGSMAGPALALVDTPPPRDEVSRRAFETVARPLLAKYCLECHSAEEQEGDLDLERFNTLDQARTASLVWQRVAEVIEKHEMPPREARQPTEAERASIQTWVDAFLAAEAARRAGDPGRVVLRRLNNAEYTFTLRDLTGINSLEPAREFPADGAAGEGFTNTGNALVMSPSLVTKYLDAAKLVAEHAVLLPDGFRFSTGTTPRDWTEETLAQIRAFYRDFTDPASGGDRVNLQGLVFETNQGGRLPIERYLAATIADRRALASGSKTFEAVAKGRGINAKYLKILWDRLNDPNPSLLLKTLRDRWRVATVEDVPALVAEVSAWQKGLWKFSSVGHIGKLNGPRAWQEPVIPLVSSWEVRMKPPIPADGQGVTVSLVATDAGDGASGDLVSWNRARLVAPGRPDLPLRDLRRVASDLVSTRNRIFADTARYLEAATEAEGLAPSGKIDVPGLATRHQLDPDALRAWLDYLGFAPIEEVRLPGLFAERITRGNGYDFINGWGPGELPQVLANSSDQLVRIPGDMKPHGLAVHPTPTLRAVVGWRSPVAATARIEARVTHAHPLCGNGVTWTLELRRGRTRHRLAEGVSQGGKPIIVPPVEALPIRVGDVVSLGIGPRDGYHACDLTAVDLKITEGDRSWDLAADVSGDILAGNPHADRQGNPAVWCFYSEPDQGLDASPAVLDGSTLARWQAARGEARTRLAAEVASLLGPDEPATRTGPDATLRRQLRSINGPLLSFTLQGERPQTPGDPAWGLDPSSFGKHVDGRPAPPDSLCVRAPSVITFRIPAELAEGAELVTTGALDDGAGPEASLQLEAVAGSPTGVVGLTPSTAIEVVVAGTSTMPERSTSFRSPVVVADGSPARRRIEAAMADFRDLFPAALCYPKIVPVDEVITLSLFHREDGPLVALMLDDDQKARIDRLWAELRFVSREALIKVDAFAQILEYASQDADPKVFEPLRQPILDGAAALRRQLVEAEPKQVEALVAFAGQAYRRPLADAEKEQLRAFYRKLRSEEIPHDEAARLVLARMLVAPAFLYRTETPGPGSGQGPVTGPELATRLSYFLWSSTPDRELLDLAASGRLADPAILMAQARRMLRDEKTRRLATEFACQWLHIADFDQHDEKSERHFPTFAKLRGSMFEESIRFFTDLFRHDGSVLGILNADHTFVDGPLAEHYGIPVPEGTRPGDWRRVDGLKPFGRGGVLGQAATLAQQSGASRTSPTLRGNWIGEVLLGDRLPRPPKGVAQLPDDEAATAGLTVRQLVEKHASDARCANCHQRIDPLGFALEAYDAIGRRRAKDLGDRPIDTRAHAADGREFEGIDGLRDYLLTDRRDAFLKQFCRKLLGFALGRSTQLSDAAVLAEMKAALEANQYRVGPSIEVIVRSRPFLEIRGRETAYTD